MAEPRERSSIGAVLLIARLGFTGRVFFTVWRAQQDDDPVGKRSSSSRLNVGWRVVLAGDESARGHDSTANDEPEIVDDPAGVADPAHDDDDPAGVADPAHNDDPAGVADPAHDDLVGVVDSPHHQDLAMDGPVEIHAPEEVLQLPAKRSSDRSSKSKRAMTTTSSGSKAPEVEQSAIRLSRSRQPKKSVASSVSVVGRPSSDWSERHRSQSGYRRQGVTSQLARVQQQGTLQLQDRIHPCYLMSAVCSARQWPKPATRVAEAATSSKTSKATDDRLSDFHVKKSSKTYSARSSLFTQSWAWSQRSPSWIWKTSRPRARHSTARLGEESETYMQLPRLCLRHSGLQQSARPHIRVSVGDEKWSNSLVPAACKQPTQLPPRAA